MGADEKEFGTTHIDSGINDDLDNHASDAVQLATEATTSKDSPWTLAMFRLYAVLSISFLCGCLNGFDGSLMGAINAMKQYQHYFGM